MSPNVSDLETARRFALQAGLELPDERLQLFGSALERTAEQAKMLLALDYGRLEPASRFAAPPARR